MFRGLVLQVGSKVVIWANFPVTREAHFNTGSRPDSRVPGTRVPVANHSLNDRLSHGIGICRQAAFLFKKHVPKSDAHKWDRQTSPKHYPSFLRAIISVQVGS